MIFSELRHLIISQSNLFSHPIFASFYKIFIFVYNYTIFFFGNMCYDSLRGDYLCEKDYKDL